MENKLRELTEKIYNEGIEKAKADAVTIIEDAQNQAEIILKNAQTEASEIISKAQANSKEIKRNAESEIKLASKQSISKLKQQITDLLMANTVGQPVKDTLKDKEFIGSLISKIAESFNNNIELSLPETDKDKIGDYFINRTKAELMKGVDINFDGNIKSGFRISPKGENYTISFTDEDFANYFKGFMRLRTIKLLFGEE